MRSDTSAKVPSMSKMTISSVNGNFFHPNSPILLSRASASDFGTMARTSTRRPPRRRRSAPRQRGGGAVAGRHPGAAWSGSCSPSWPRAGDVVRSRRVHLPPHCRRPPATAFECSDRTESSPGAAC